MKKSLCLLLAILIAVVGAISAPVALSEAMTEKCPDLAVRGGLVWRVDDTAILCEDVESGEVRATLPLSELHAPDEAVFRVSLTGWTEDSVLVALGIQDASNAYSLRLLALGLTDGDIAVVNEYDAAETLAFLADGGAEWYEVNLVGCGQRLFIAALDSAYQMHFYSYAPDADALTALGERSLVAYTAALPYGDGILIAGPNEADDSLLELTQLSLEDGSATPVEAMALDSALHAANFAWDESEGLLYYTYNNTVYAFTPGRGETPKAVGTLASAPAELRLGAIAGDQFVALSEDGALLHYDVHGPVALSAQLRVANLAGDETVAEAARDFGVANPGCTVSVNDAVEETDALAALDSHSPEYDAYVLTLNSSLYQSFRDAGFMADLSPNATLSAAVADMTGQMAAALRDDGKLYAMPLAVGSSCQLLNIPALEALTGLSRDALPTDWAGFLALLGQIADSGALLGDGDYALFDMALPVEGMRDMLFGWLLQDCLLWVQADDTAIDDLPQALAPVLKAFDAVDWSRLADAQAGSLTGDTSSMTVNSGDSGRIALVSDGMLDIAVGPQAEGTELWPLSIVPGGDRLIGQAVSVICVNAWSANPEAALAFVAHAWEKTYVETRMALCQSMNEPVVNTAYKEDLGYMTEDLAMLQQALAEAQSPDERAYLQSELDQLAAYMEDYQANAQWLVSEESIARYRGYADALVPIAPEFGYEGPIGDLMYQFLDGMISAEQFTQQLAKAL